PTPPRRRGFSPAGVHLPMAVIPSRRPSLWERAGSFRPNRRLTSPQRHAHALPDPPLVPRPRVGRPQPVLHTPDHLGKILRADREDCLAEPPVIGREAPGHALRRDLGPPLG